MPEWTEEEIWKIYNRLLKWGCDIPTARERFLEDDELYLRCLERFSKTPAFGVLQKSLSAEDYASAYETAHLMKGTSATLEITPFFDRVRVLLSYLEKGKRPPEEDIEELYRTYACFQALVLSMESEESS